METNNVEQHLKTWTNPLRNTETDYFHALLDKLREETIAVNKYQGEDM